MWLNILHYVWLNKGALSRIRDIYTSHTHTPYIIKVKENNLTPDKKMSYVLGPTRPILML